MTEATHHAPEMRLCIEASRLIPEETHIRLPDGSDLPGVQRIEIVVDARDYSQCGARLTMGPFWIASRLIARGVTLNASVEDVNAALADLAAEALRKQLAPAPAPPTSALDAIAEDVGDDPAFWSRVEAEKQRLAAEQEADHLMAKIREAHSPGQWDSEGNYTSFVPGSEA